MNLPNIMRVNVPAWYDLSIDGTDVLITVYGEHCQRILNLNPEVRGVRLYRQVLGVGPFHCTNTLWGYEHALNYHCPTVGTLQLRIKLHRMVNVDPLGYNVNRRLSASLGLLFDLLFIQPDDPACNAEYQLMTVNSFMVGENEQGCSMFVTVSQRLRDWLNKFVKTTMLDGPTQAMVSAHQIMWPEFVAADRGSGVYVETPRWLTLCVIGNDICLNPHDRACSPGGYKMSSNNINCLAHQLVILTGLAAVCEMARKDGF